MKENHERTSYFASLRFTLTMTIVLVQTGYAQQPTLTWLGTVGGNKSDAYSVSANGAVVVGVSRDSNGSPRAFKWTSATGIQNLGTLGGDWSEATDVSADGSIIVGWSHDSSGITRAFKWTATTGMQDLGTGDFSKASAISSDGSVIAVNRDMKAFRWTSSGLDSLGNLGGNWTDASAMSGDGNVIVGFSRNAATDPYAFRWVNGIGMQQIGTFYSFARGVSNDGSTVTGFETGSAGLYRAFRWTQSGGFQFNIAGNFSQGNAVSGNGEFTVGDNGNGAFRFSTAGGVEVLNQVYASLLQPGSDMYTASDISPDAQFIVGTGTFSGTSRDEGFLLTLGGTTTVDPSLGLPSAFVLLHNYPNPFNPSTTIKFHLPVRSAVTLDVIDPLGRTVATVIDESRDAGDHTTIFDARELSNGVYFLRLSAGAQIQTRKMMLLK